MSHIINVELAAKVGRILVNVFLAFSFLSFVLSECYSVMQKSTSCFYFLNLLSKRPHLMLQKIDTFDVMFYLKHLI